MIAKTKIPSSFHSRTHKEKVTEKKIKTEKKAVVPSILFISIFAYEVSNLAKENQKPRKYTTGRVRRT